MLRPAILSLIATLQPLSAFAEACSRPEPPRFEVGTKGPEGGVSISVGRIADLIWVPKHIDGQPVPEDAGLSLTVTFDGKVSGTTGCNRFTGTADLDAAVIQFSPLAVTEMACADPAAMEREAAYLKALAEVRWFIASPEGLWLQREDNTVAMCLW